MKLRARLALTVLIAAVPLVAGVAWLRSDLSRRNDERWLREFAAARLDASARARCEEAPERFFIVSGVMRGPRGMRGPAGPGEDVDPSLPPPPPPPPEGAGERDRGERDRPERAPTMSRVTLLWAYASDFTSANPRAPQFPASLAQSLRAGEDFVSEPWQDGDRTGRQAGVRTAWSGGACAFALVRFARGAEGEIEAFPLWIAAAVVAVMLGVVLLATGHVVRRIGRLTDGVRRAADERYAVTVDARGDDEIAELGRAFDEAGAELREHIAQLEAREETLRNFLANTTHDLMTPLTVLQGHVSEIRRRVVDGRTVDPELAGIAMEETHHLASLVHNMGAVAKLDAGLQQVHLAPVSMSELVRRTVERYWPLASPRAIEVDFAVPETEVWFDADVTLLEQAVSNVVGNAVRYNRAGGHVAVVLELRSENEFSLRVVDDGPGVPDEHLANLGLREFRTDEARAHSPEGTGLGLDITRRVAEFHRLRISFRRSEYGGLEVEFRGVRGEPPKKVSGG